MISGKLLDDLRKSVSSRMSEKRYIHTLGVEKAAILLSEYCLPFLKVGGTFVAYKSGDTSEIYEAKSAFKELGASLDNVVEYSLPENFGDRSIALVKKVNNTPKKYPRGQGK